MGKFDHRGGFGLRHSGPPEVICDSCPPRGAIPHFAHRHPPEPLKSPGPAHWIIRGELIGFSRLREDDQTVIFREVDDAELFSLADFLFDEEVGYRGVALANLGPKFGVEVVYTRLHDEFNDDQRVDDGIMPDVEPFELRAAGIVLNNDPAVTGEDTFDVRYTTRFQSAELNGKYYFDYWSTNVFGGFRWVEMDERFVAGITNLPPQFTVNTKNKLLGTQIGIESQHWIGYGILRLDSSLRGGVFYNMAEQRTQLDVVSAGGSDTNFAWVGESEIALTVPVNRNASFRVSYRLIHLAGVALAADQINVTDLSVPVGDVYDDSQSIYHGWSIGFEAWH